MSPLELSPLIVSIFLINFWDDFFFLLETFIAMDVILPVSEIIIYLTLQPSHPQYFTELKDR